MCEIVIKTNENELVLYNLLINMSNNSKYSKNIEENLKRLLSILEKNLSKDIMYNGYNIEDSTLVGIINLKKENHVIFN